MIRKMEKENVNNPNRLAGEKSPYLLQHSLDPVDWYPWGPEPFEKAQRENKLIFLSIGYSTCHWCHVMEHESFEDEIVAQLINKAFVSIKVDREERPDIDAFYMNMCQYMTGSGGWPLSIIMTPQKQPFYFATYIPKETRFGRIGLVDLIPQLVEVWKTQQMEVLNSANEIFTKINLLSQTALAGQEAGKEELNLAFKELEGRFDSKYGGFGSAPKFPTSHQLTFILRYWKRTGNSEALKMVEKTLQALRSGGIYDQIGFGFHRYSTDQFWLVPHFEKMLYDQALLAVNYLEAFQATQKPEYAATAQEIYTYVLRDMTAPGGGFYSAEDADSEGREGKFYLWSYDEIQRMLGPVEAEFCRKLFNLKEHGNFMDEVSGENSNNNILHLSRTWEKIAAEFTLSLPQLQEHIQSITAKLLAERNLRMRPAKDDKIMVDWNGLMIASLARGARVLNDSKLAAAAQYAADFIIKNMLAGDGRLLHRFRDGEAAIQAFVDDYAFFIYGLLELYETTFDAEYLKIAVFLNKYFINHFWDTLNGGFYFGSDDSEQFEFRRKEIYDGALPSGNSVAMLNLLHLGRLTASPELERMAAQIGRSFAQVIKSPSAYTQLMVAVDFAVGPSYEVVIKGYSKAQDTANMLRCINREFVPNKVLLFVPEEIASPEIISIAPFTQKLGIIDNKATAYVCLNYQCQLPTTDPAIMLSLLNSEQNPI
jgi:uncharacterized protein